MMKNVYKRILGYFVHILTASGALAGLFALLFISEGRLIEAFWFMALAVIIDAIDGGCARAIRLSNTLPNIDGALLDNMVDYFNYVLVPCFFLLKAPIVSAQLQFPCVIFIILASSYQFSQKNAKTSDHFFQGFPSYWNIIVFYLYYLQTNTTTNTLIILFLCVMSFIPIKYIYPTRLEYLSHNVILRRLMALMTLIFTCTIGFMIFSYPEKHLAVLCISASYVILYTLISLYRTFFPLAHKHKTRA